MERARLRERAQRTGAGNSKLYKYDAEFGFGILHTDTRRPRPLIFCTLKKSLATEWSGAARFLFFRPPAHGHRLSSAPASIEMFFKNFLQVAHILTL